MAKPKTDPAVGPATGSFGPAARDQVKAFAERISNLMNQKDEITADMTSVFNEAKDAGFDSKILRKAIKVIRTDPAARRSEEEQIETYVQAIQPDFFAEAA